MPTREATGTRRGRPNDPARRGRIIEACLEVISRSGVAGTSHRGVAAEAGVPLGAMTYYFAGMEDLLTEAFTRFAHSVSDRFERRMTEADDLEAAREAVVEIVLDDVSGDDRELVLAQELYTLAAREARFRSITSEWMRRSRTALERHFDSATARILDALIEGLTLHHALDESPRTRHEVRIAVDRITAR